MLPERRSHDYKCWLAIKLAEIAAALGQQQQLDSAGIRQTAFAEALEDTTPSLMHRAMQQWVRREKFLPTPTEMRGYYDVEFHDFHAARLTKERAAEDKRTLAEIAAHPEDYFTFEDIVRERPEYEDHFAMLDHAKQRRDHPPPRTPEPQTDECPHCGKPLPHSITDLNIFSAADLRTMADRRDAKAAENAAAKASMDARVDEDRAAATKADAAREKRLRKADQRKRERKAR
jgi:hypothetical protein